MVNVLENDASFSVKIKGQEYSGTLKGKKTPNNNENQKNNNSDWKELWSTASSAIYDDDNYLVGYEITFSWWWNMSEDKSVKEVNVELLSVDSDLTKPISGNMRKTLTKENSRATWKIYPTTLRGTKATLLFEGKKIEVLLKAS